MAENTVNNNENLNSLYSQLEEKDLQNLEADSVPVNTKKPRVVNPWPGGEVQVSFKPNALCSPIMPNCRFSNCTINFNTYKYALSNFPFISSIMFENSKVKILSFLASYCVFSLREN